MKTKFNYQKYMLLSFYSIFIEFLLVFIRFYTENKEKYRGGPVGPVVSHECPPDIAAGRDAEH